MPTPSRTGYTFNGWYTASSGGSLVSSPYTPSVPYGPINLYAQWSVNTYTVTYNSGGGSYISNGSYNAEGNISLPTPTRAGYTFSGWYTANYNGYLISSPHTPASPYGGITLYAKWSPHVYTLTYDSQGGSLLAPRVYESGGKIILPFAPTRSGYTFNGWFTSSTGGTALTSPYSPSSAGNITLYAQWIKNYKWSTSTLPLNAGWDATAYGDGIFVTVAQNSTAVAYSTDGINWLESNLETADQWCSITHGNGLFVAVSIFSANAAISTDGITWSTSTLPEAAFWYGIAYGNGLFVTTSLLSTTAATSTDGITWMQTVVPNTFYTSITYGNGLFAAANYNYVAISTDGATWIENNLLEGPDNPTITYGNNLFVIVSNASTTAIYSSDAITWSTSNLPNQFSSNYPKITYGGGLFVSVAQYSSIAAISTDGITWVASTLPSEGGWGSIAYGNGLFVTPAISSTTAATLNVV